MSTTKNQKYNSNTIIAAIKAESDPGNIEKLKKLLIAFYLITGFAYAPKMFEIKGTDVYFIDKDGKKTLGTTISNVELFGIEYSTHYELKKIYKEQKEKIALYSMIYSYPDDPAEIFVPYFLEKYNRWINTSNCYHVKTEIKKFCDEFIANLPLFS